MGLSVVLFSDSDSHLGAFLRQVRETGDLSNEWYWISQLYDEKWLPDKMD